jgi:hypothetical protein
VLQVVAVELCEELKSFAVDLPRPEKSDAGGLLR